MATLLILKIMVPFVILCSSFQILCLSPRKDSQQALSGLGLPGASPLVLAACMATDVLALNFLYAVQDTGSWLEIGQSITHFVMANLLQVFILALTAGSAAFIGASHSSPKSKSL